MMKTDELIIQMQQPSCGGKSPYKSEIRNVTIDDPVAYVQKLEPDSKLEVTELDDGAIMIMAQLNSAWIKYEFCED